MIKRLWGLSGGTWLLVMASATALANESRPLPARYDAIMTDAKASGVLIVVDHGRTVIAKGYGEADRERRLSYGPNTVHDIGSLTKPFTAAAVMDLVLAGRIDLHAPVRRYLPDAADPIASVTIEQLLTHRSGMVEYCGDEKEDATKQAMLTRCMAAPLRFPAGSDWAYSNPGFSTLAMIVEAVSKRPLDEYLKARFFRPLGMNRTGYVVAGNRPTAIGYDGGKMHVPFNGARVIDGHHWNIAGNGGMQSTASDMKRWFEALSRPGPVLSEQLRLALTTPHIKRSAQLSDGYDWAFLLRPDGTTVSMSHSGSDGVFYSYFYWNRVTDRFFYFNSNTGEDEALKIIRLIRQLTATE